MLLLFPIKYKPQGYLRLTYLIFDDTTTPTTSISFTYPPHTILAYTVRGNKSRSKYYGPRKIKNWWFYYFYLTRSIRFCRAINNVVSRYQLYMCAYRYHYTNIYYISTNAPYAASTYPVTLLRYRPCDLMLSFVLRIVHHLRPQWKKSKKDNRVESSRI